MSAHARVILKTKKKQQLNKQHTVKLTMNVVTEITVSRFLLQRSSARLQNFKKKQKIFKNCTNALDGA